MAQRQVKRRVRRPARRPAPRATPKATQRRGPVHIRLRVGFILVAMVLSVFGGRLVQLQGIDPHSYAAMAAAENVVDVVLPAERGEILDRDGEALADSSDGLMVLADPKQTKKDAPAIAAFLAKELGVDYASALAKLRKDGSRFQYIKRQVPATQATAAVEKAGKAGYQGLWTSRDPLRNYPNGDVAANLVGFLGNDQPLAGLEAAFDKHLAGKDGHAEYDATSPVSGTRMPLGTNNRVDPVDGNDLTLTIDRDLQYYVQQTLMDAVQKSRAESGMAVVMDTQTGEILSLADYPTFDARDPAASPKSLRGSNALSNVYEPGSVQKVLTVAGLLDQGLVSPSTRLKVPGSYRSGDADIHDWYEHGMEKLTLAGVIAKSSNIGTVMAADKYEDGQLRDYLAAFGQGRRTGLGLDTESAGLLASPETWNPADEDRIDFGQSISVNAVQMTAALNTIANGGVHIDPSLIAGSATNNSGAEVGTDTARAQPRGLRGGGLPDRGDDGAGHQRPRQRHRQAGRRPRLPRLRQDRYRAAGQLRVQVLRRHHHGLLRRFRPHRRPAFHGLRGHPQPRQRRRRWHRHRPGLLPDHVFRPAPLRRPADRHRAFEDAYWLVRSPVWDTRSTGYPWA